jgi:biofilm PGA synthesis N-glycosyltransferase PgaC
MTSALDHIAGAIIAFADVAGIAIDLLRGVAHDLLIAMRLVFYYPLVMAYVWMIGSIIFYLQYERGQPDVHGPVPVLARYPKVAIVVPCHNEGDNVRDTIAFAARQQYPDFEIIAVNDASRDATLAILTELALVTPNMRVINLATNQGKAMGMRTAAMLSDAEIIIGIDGDSLLAPEATNWLVKHFIEDANVGAVTGNPRVRNRTTLIGRIQVGEFSAIVGMIKRAQQSYGRIFTVSGVIAAFRRSALHEVGYWSTDMVTEDIDISWKLQLSGWRIQFEPNALCWVLMPESVRGLWRQRARWAQGGAEVMLRYTPQILRWRSRRLWPLWTEYWISIVWSYLLTLALASSLVHIILPDNFGWAVDVMPRWFGVLLSVTCLFQFGVSLFIDSRYEARNGGLGRYYFWIIWYPIAYWAIGVSTALVGIQRALRRKRGAPAIWGASDRGLQPS